LITWLLRDTPGWSRERVDEMFRNGERLDVQLAQPVNVYFAYVSAWATADGIVHFRNDIYGQDGIGQVASAN
jgi:murein L,D-transpeptidase YcbB/YkuD